MLKKITAGKHVVYFGTLLLITFVLTTTPLLIDTAAAQTQTEKDADGKKPEKKKRLSKAEKEANLKYKKGITRKRKAVGAGCAKRLEKVQELTAEENWSGAERELKASFSSRGCKEGFEHSEVNRFLGYVLYSQEKYKEAIEAYLAVVNEPEADNQKRTDTRYTAAQLMFVTENFKGAVEQLELWKEEVSVVDKGGLILLARGYYSLDRKADALVLVEQVMAQAKEVEQVPRESWLNFQWVLYYEKNEYKKAVGVNHVLLTHYPKIKYWKQLSAMYGALEQTDKETLALELTYLQRGLDKEKQYVALAYQYMALDIPYRGALILAKAMKAGHVERSEKNLDILGAAYQRAQEYTQASPALEAAAKKSSKGNSWSRLAGVYLNLNENKKALDAAKNALKKGGLKREDLAWMNRGSAEASLHCYKDAASSFAKAAKFEKSKKSALNWKKYVEAEGERRRKLISNGAPLSGCKKA